MMINNNVIDDQKLDNFCKLIYNEAGLVLDKPKYRSRIRYYIQKRMDKLGISNPDKYIDDLWFEAGKNKELRELINTVVVNETLFYRYESQLKFLQDSVFPRLFKQRLLSSSRPIHILSAGCSNGAEPYSMAIAYLETCEKLGFDRADTGLKIVGMDISTKMLNQAREASYDPRAVENAPAEIVEKYFTKKGNKYFLSDRVKKLVNFKFANLVDVALPLELDIIFCRNVLIYFDEQVRSRLFRKFHSALLDEGLFFLGPSEAIRPYHEYFHKHRENRLQIYQKWTTDRRVSSVWERKKTDKKSVIEKRSPEYLKSRPRILSKESYTERKQLIEFSGVIASNVPATEFKEKVAKNIIPGQKFYFFDLRQVKYIENFQLRQFGQILEELVAEDKPEKIKIITSDQKLKKYFCSGIESSTIKCQDEIIELEKFRTKRETVFENKDVKPTREKTKILRQNGSRSAVDDLLKTVGRDEVQNSKPKIELTEEEQDYVFYISGTIDSQEYNGFLNRFKEEVTNLLSLLAGNSELVSRKLKIVLNEVDFIDLEAASIIGRALGTIESEGINVEIESNKEEIKDRLIRWGGLSEKKINCRG